MKKFLYIVLLAILVPSLASALTLDEAKAKGAVGEQTNGYLGVVTASEEAKALVSEINAKRKEKYQEIAKERGTALEAVEKLAAKKAIEMTETGQYYRLPSGEWKKK